MQQSAFWRVMLFLTSTWFHTLLCNPQGKNSNPMQSIYTAEINGGIGCSLLFSLVQIMCSISFLETLSRPQVHAGSSTNKSSVPLIQLFLTTAKRAKPIETTCFQNMFLTLPGGWAVLHVSYSSISNFRGTAMHGIGDDGRNDCRLASHRRAQGVRCVKL